MAEDATKAGGAAWMFGLLSWLVPGIGHLLQGRWRRGVLLGGCVIGLFAAGLLLGGHLFDLTDFSGGLLAQVFGLFDLGSGLLYGVAQMLGLSAANTSESAARSTYEYGNTFLMIAGLVNYLVMLDAFDISAGRKN
ncbi:MAG: hypothetical protein H0V88_05555 [Pyrinomonadaceae bacterium]|nr:hypothetical protein [Pyrinomonadaceae bacterium]